MTSPDPTSSEDSAPAPPPHSDEHGSSASMSELFGSIKDALFELAEYVVYYVAARFDLAKVAWRQLMLWGALMAMAIIAATAIVVAATVLVCIGIAQGLGNLLGSQWIANILTGLGVIAGVAALGRSTIRRFANLSTYEEKAAKYDHLRHRQRSRFGRDVSDWEDGENHHE